MRKIRLWLISVAGCLVLAVGWGILPVPDTALAAKGGKKKEANPFFLVTIPPIDDFGVPTDAYIPDSFMVDGMANSVVMEGFANRDGIITTLEGLGSLTFPTDGIIGNGIGDIGDVLVLLNGQNCELFDPDTAVNADGSVTLNSGLDHPIEIFVRPDEAGVSVMNAFIRLTFHGTESKVKNHQILVGGPDKNWCVLPDLAAFPDMSTVRGGVDPESCFIDNMRKPGQTFRITQGFSGNDPCRWNYGDSVEGAGPTRAYVVIRTMKLEPCP